MLRMVYRWWQLSKPDRITGIGTELYVGDYTDAVSAAPYVDEVFSVAKDAAHDQTDYYFELTPHGDCPQSEFAAAVDVLRRSLYSRQSVIVHCHEGRERAPTVVATALAATHHLPFGRVVTWIEKDRPVIAPTDALRNRADEYLAGDIDG